ncbi:DUF3558 domain-containing protein [Nocardia macrotermitis]|uniref:DUF3558 domain-containing protein n=1 Tax=Nocardia macrotermitis TaxID=2585198 RepID=A0A7K0D439_9NOCA|nr:DUF3558 domain-containing protein [Nocardia macrotermitis]MQY20513.1 hypothetical protein [Nocardia macrotermitis]
MMRRLGAITLAVVAGLALAGCGKSDTSTTAVSEKSVATSAAPAAAQWDPCTISDASVSGLALDPSTKTDKVAGTTFDGWKVCSWGSMDKKFDFSILTSSRTIDDFRKRTDFTDFTPTTVAGRQALQYRPVGASHDYGCSIDVQITGGTADFDLLNRYGADGLAEPCGIVRRLADALAQFLPQN